MIVHLKECKEPLKKLDDPWGGLKKIRGEKEAFKKYHSPKGQPEKLNGKMCKMI